MYMYDVGLVFSSGLTLVLNIFCSFFSAKTIVHVEAINGLSGSGTGYHKGIARH